jgi:hypothetical protein
MQLRVTGSRCHTYLVHAPLAVMPLKVACSKFHNKVVAAYLGRQPLPHAFTQLSEGGCTCWVPRVCVVQERSNKYS